tara:strand:- start:11944 stop:12378 length:435 start_codon:yes stop_codon:yes gene_type:complete
MKISAYKRSVLLSGTGIDEHASHLKDKFKAKKTTKPKGMIISKHYLSNVVSHLKYYKVRLQIDDTLKPFIRKTNTNVSIKKFKPLSEPLLRFYISSMFQKPNSTFAKNQLKSHGYTKQRVIYAIKNNPFQHKNYYLSSIDKVWN